MQEGVQVLKPPTRCFSEFPEWVDRNADLLEGKRVLMYCTGGVRCERASAYVRQKGPAFQDVLQLRGVCLDGIGLSLSKKNQRCWNAVRDFRMN